MTPTPTQSGPPTDPAGDGSPIRRANRPVKLTVVLPTSGRATLVNALNSLAQLGPDDELILCLGPGGRDALRMLAEAAPPCKVVAVRQPGRADGGPPHPRDRFSPLASGDYVLHLEETDAYVPGALDAVRAGAAGHPGKMLIFGAAAEDRPIPWPGERSLWFGNVSTQCVAVPNDPGRWGSWAEGVGGDYHFFSSCKFETVWVDRLIAVLHPHRWQSPAEPFVSVRDGERREPAPAAEAPAARAAAAGGAAAGEVAPRDVPRDAPQGFGFSTIAPDGTAGFHPLGGPNGGEALYAPGRPPRTGLVIGTYASVPYVHLGLESWKRHYRHVGLLVHDDCSPRRDELEALCRAYGAGFESNSEKKFHTVGDLTVFLGGLLWARREGLDLLVKFSRRFIPLYDWTPGLWQLAGQSQDATFSNICRNLNWGFRSEVVAMHAATWARWAQRIEWDVLNQQDVFVEGTIHALAKAIRPCRRNEEYRRQHPRDEWCAGYCPWPLLGENRVVKVQDVLWHHACPPADYYQVARAWGLPYSLRDFEIADSHVRDQ